MTQSQPAKNEPNEIWVWPCDHGGVQVEYGPVPSNYACHQCGATSAKYVLASVAEARAEAAAKDAFAQGYTG
jgi:hypothetical protein